MAAKDKKITLKSLHSDIIILKKRTWWKQTKLKWTPKRTEEEKKEPKFMNNKKKDAPASNSSSTKGLKLHNSEISIKWELNCLNVKILILFAKQKLN